MSDKNNHILNPIKYVPVPEEIMNMTLDEIMRSRDASISSTFNKDGSLRNLNIKATVNWFKINVEYKGPKRGRWYGIRKFILL